MSTKEERTAMLAAVEKPIYKIMSFDEIEQLPPPEWVIDQHFTENTVNAIWGESGSGKSFVALAMSMAIAHGIPYLGLYKTQKSSVLYIASEGGRGIAKRARAWCQAYELPLPEDMQVCSNAVNIPGEWRKFIECAKTKFGEYPKFIVIDTLHKNFGGGNENDAKDMGVFLNAVGQMSELTKATIVIVHHSGKNVSNGPRGSYSLTCDIDTSFYIEGLKKADNPNALDAVMVECQKQKDDEPIARYYLKAVCQGNSLAVVPMDQIEEQLKNIRNSKSLTEFLVSLYEIFGEGQFTRDDIYENVKGKVRNTYDNYVLALARKDVLIRTRGANEGGHKGKQPDLFCISGPARAWLESRDRGGNATLDIATAKLAG
jgi:ABC-type dipeptide/oligopeptide/nickel transport system ATPase component